uniref:CSON014114 protein n=1 Tax=Culicoides sonorensis TaxID=179676 RepID=A0A336KD61_CULSO
MIVWDKKMLPPPLDKPDSITQIMTDIKNLLRDRLRMGSYKISPALREVLIASFTKSEFGDLIYSTPDHVENILSFVIPTLLQKNKKVLIFSPSFLHQPTMKATLNELNLDTAIYNHRTDFDVREEMKKEFTDPDSKLNFFHATPEMYTKGNQWFMNFANEVAKLKKIDFVVITHAEWILDDFKQFKDYRNLEGLKDANRAIKWIILGNEEVKREHALTIAKTFGLRNPHFISNEGESIVLLEKPFYYHLERVYYLDKSKYLD